MYVVTFYSFKGGVGRTLALANVGVELARSGRRVLLVDFDLEAPGLDTFGRLRAREAQRGIVEYVSEFLATRSAPDVRGFLYEVAEIGRDDGRLWVMPAGRNDEEYSRKLGNINWEKVYQDCDGFLMVEDMKAQWEKELAPDYVLIDSRTGHTDIGGICTRQLPDAVVLLFFPNEQNLSGLRPIVAGVKAEGEVRKEREIQLHYVMSNVPDLDDEEEILAGMQERFRTDLGYEELTCTIHRYDSLSLLKQALFALERPRSRLAKEYHSLMSAVTMQNLEDREAVKRRLAEVKEMGYGVRLGRERESLDELAGRIRECHSGDGEIMYMLSRYLSKRGRLQEAEILLKKSLELGHRSAAALLDQAEISLQEKRGGGREAWDNIREAFELADLDQDEIVHGVEILRRVAPERVREVVRLPAVRSLSGVGCKIVSYELLWCKAGLEAAVELAAECVKKAEMHEGTRRGIRRNLALAFIGLGRFDEAIGVLGRERSSPGSRGIEESFNYAVAEWGATKKVPRDIFEQVVTLDGKERATQGANYSQCLALAFWAVGRREDAIERLERATKQIEESAGSVFSCWRYMNVTPGEFLQDCEEMKRMIEGENVYPKFFGDKRKGGRRADGGEGKKG